MARHFPSAPVVGTTNLLQSISYSFLVGSSFLKVPPAASFIAETCLPSLAEILLSCGEVYPKIFSSSLKCLCLNGP